MVPGILIFGPSLLYFSVSRGCACNGRGPQPYKHNGFVILLLLIMVRRSQVWSPEFWFSGRHCYISVSPVDVPATVVGLSHISTTGLWYYYFFYNYNYYVLCYYYTCTSFINIIICWTNLKCLAQWFEHALLNRETRVRSLPSTGRVLQNCRSVSLQNFCINCLDRSR